MVVRILSASGVHGSVLDAAAGPGDISRMLREADFDVRAADIEPGVFNVPGLACDMVNLNHELPYDDESFDCIVCSNAIEHLEDQYCFVRESYRVLKPEGRLLIATPNLLSLKARVAHMFVGWPDFHDRPQNEVDKYEGGQHINLVTYFDLRANLHRNGFRIIDVRTHAYSTTALLLAFLVPFVAVLTVKSFARERNRAQRERNREILGHVFSGDLLFGKKLFILAQKDERSLRT